jgi:hypothetical protein
MPRYFTHYWKKETCADGEVYAGHLLSYTASNLFRKRGVRKGDVIYPVTVRRGRLFLIGRLAVRHICGRIEAAREIGTDDLWKGADEYAISASETPMHFHIEVPSEVTEKLLFVASPHSEPLRFREPGYLDKQTLRGVRDLEPASARALDDLLPPDKRV